MSWKRLSALTELGLSAAKAGESAPVEPVRKGPETELPGTVGPLPCVIQRA